MRSRIESWFRGYGNELRGGNVLSNEIALFKPQRRHTREIKCDCQINLESCRVGGAFTDAGLYKGLHVQTSKLRAKAE